jgi:anti-sigma factor RsiW
VTGTGAVSGADHPVDESDLQAWVDDRLPPERQRIVAAWLATRPEQKDRVRVLREQRDLLRAALASVLEEPVPARLSVASLAAAHRQGRRTAVLRAGYVLGSLAAGTALGWFGRDLLERVRGAAPGGRMVAEAVAAHRVFVPDARRPVEVAAAQEAQLVQWLSNRLGRHLTVPDLTALGFQLVGGRLLPGAAGQPAAQMMYQNGRGERLTLYLRADPDGQETAFRFVEDPASGVAAFWWVDRGFGYAVAARTDRAELLRVAEAVYRQLDRS